MRYLIIIALLFSPIAHATTKPSAYALSWWVNEQGKAGTIRTAQKDGQYVITEWGVTGVPQPTDAEIVQIIKDYEKDYVPPKTLEERVTALENQVSVLETP